MKNLRAKLANSFVLMLLVTSAFAEEQMPEDLISSLRGEAGFIQQDKAFTYFEKNPVQKQDLSYQELRNLATTGPNIVVRKRALRALFYAAQGSGWIGFNYLNNPDEWYAELAIRYVNKFPDSDVCLGLLEKESVVVYSNPQSIWWLSAINYCRPKKIRSYLQKYKVEITPVLYFNLWRGYVWRINKKRQAVIKAKARYLAGLKKRKKKPKKKRRFSIPKIKRKAFLSEVFGSKLPEIANEATVSTLEVEATIQKKIEAGDLSCDACAWKFEEPIADLALFKAAYTKWAQ